MKSTILPWTSGYSLRSRLRRSVMLLSSFLRFFALMGVSELPPTQTTLRFLGMIAPPMMASFPRRGQTMPLRFPLFLSAEESHPRRFSLHAPLLLYGLYVLINLDFIQGFLP